MKKTYLAVAMATALTFNTAAVGYAAVPDSGVETEAEDKDAEKEDLEGSEIKDTVNPDGEGDNQENPDGEGDNQENPDGEGDNQENPDGEGENQENPDGEGDNQKNPDGEGDNQDGTDIDSIHENSAVEDLEDLIKALPSQDEFSECLEIYENDEDGAAEYIDSIREKVEEAIDARDALSENELKEVNEELIELLNMWKLTVDMYGDISLYSGTYEDEVISSLESGGEVILEQNVNFNQNIIIPEGEVSVLDLNGHTLSNTETLAVLGDLTIEGESGRIVSKIQLGTYDEEQNTRSKGASLTIDGDITLYFKENGIAVFGDDSELNFNNGEIDAKYFAIAGNGTSSKTNHSVINISGGDIRVREDVAIYHPQRGDSELNITGGTISGDWAAVQMCSGSLNISGDPVISATSQSEFPEKNDSALDGSIDDGAAISIINRIGYGGNININISGGTFSSESSAVKYYGVKGIKENGENRVTLDNTVERMTDSFTITGGTFIGETNAIRDFYLEAINENEIHEENSLIGLAEITGGRYSTDVSAYVADGYKCVESGSEYVVVDAAMSENSLTEAATDVTVSADKDSAVAGVAEGLDQAKAEEAVNKAEKLFEDTVNEAGSNTAVSDFADTGLAGAVDTSVIPANAVGNTNLAEVFISSDLKDVEFETSVAEDGTVSVSVSKLIFDIKPFIKEPGKAPVEIDNDWLNKKIINIRIPVPSSRAKERGYVKIRHIADDGTERVYYPDVNEENGQYYCQIRVTHFSIFEMTFEAKPAATTGSSSHNESNRNVISQGTIYADGTVSGNPNLGGMWKQDSTGWWYERTDGSYPVNAWAQLSWNGRTNWYHFNAAGYLDAGWFTDSDGNTYYLHDVHDNSFGYMYTGWNMINGKYYYFFAESSEGIKAGSLAKGTVTPDGYRVDENGVWAE